MNVATHKLDLDN